VVVTTVVMLLDSEFEGCWTILACDVLHGVAGETTVTTNVLKALEKVACCAKTDSGAI